VTDFLIGGMASELGKTTEAIERLTREITPPNEVWRSKARSHLDTLTKPIGSLGRLEDLAAQMVAIRQARFGDPVRKAVYIFAADHGITAEGVSAYPREVTHQMVLNFLAEGAAINVLARLHGTALRVIDVGVDADLKDTPGLLRHKVRKASRNMLQEAAMSEEEVRQALLVGVQLGADAAAEGHTLIAIGEMGIGNTTAASAITCALTGVSATLATGHGTGVDHAQYAHKTRIVEAVVAKHCDVSKPPSPLEILRCVGGLEIAAMTGMVLSAARHGLAIVMDGFISTAAGTLAAAIEPNVQGYLIAGHCSEEPGHKVLLDRLKLAPILTLGMRLGEGTGAVLAMPVVESAISLYTQMATFASAGVSGVSR
jgi:nicotinate-nucleotide--dimethylbenzimidazole phosphoribosyltransferase